MSVGCLHTPMHDYCDSSNPCKMARCDLFLGCVLDDKNCDDSHPCTIDSCTAGECKHTSHGRCNDNLRCTGDFCSPEIDSFGNNSTSLFRCDYVFDRSNCGNIPNCQDALCATDTDCHVVSHDDRCPTHPNAIICLVPQCTKDGCGFRDVCDISNKQCEGCADCSCNVALNKCVKSCPSKRNVDDGIEEVNGCYIMPYSLLFLILCLILINQVK
jgi:hypothetical protein